MSFGNLQVIEYSAWILVFFCAHIVNTQQNVYEYDENYVTDHRSSTQYGVLRSQGSSCYDDFRKPLRCIPEFVNAAFKVRVEATNTCGLRGPLKYCLQTGATGAEKSCDYCDASNISLAHPPEYLTDFNNNDNQTWWQSETMLENIQFPVQVNLTLHLGKAFDITYVRLKFHSSRPESFAIYKRTNESGPWIPYQYYSATCRGTYGIPDKSYVTKEDETKALCTSEYSDISPLTGGNVAFSTLEGRPSAYDFEHSPVLQEWVTATDIRITLDRVNTFGDEIFGDTQVLQSYYYAVSDFAVGGRCKCNGHASECVLAGNQLNPWEPRLVCQCEHNTAGPDCNECLPFYNDQPWARSTGINVHECKPCNCNGRATRCYFDEELWQQTGHGGHCIDCIDNTDGANCERCKENYYQREDERCVPCNCDAVGSNSLQCNNKGQCSCKYGVEGQRCNKCIANFYDFDHLGCKPCGCNADGSFNNIPTCDQVTGVCSCKDNVEGQRCDHCKPGYFDLQSINEFGCLPCFCFGHSSICQSAPGYSPFTLGSTFYRDNERWITKDYYKNEIQSTYNFVTQDISVAAPSRDVVYFIAPARYLGDQRSSYNQFLQFTFRVGEKGPQATLEDVVLEGALSSISLPIFGQGNPLPSTLFQEYKFRLHEHSAYGWNPRLSSHDFMTILSNLTAIKIKATYTPRGSGFLSNVELQTAHRSSLHGTDATWIEMCTCPEGYVGQFCESCAPGFRHDPPNGGRFSQCVPCNCHGHAELCDAESGRCICKPDTHTAGDNCELCAPGYYGNALQNSPDACQPCPCPDNGACAILPDEEVACLVCPEGYAGHKCNLCVDGYYGEPADEYDLALCRKCNCNENVDPNAIGNCDRVTGECLKCVYNTGGRHCESCLPGYWGDALVLPKGNCKACNCYRPGTYDEDLDEQVLVCDYATGECPCLPNVIGQQCDTCEDGFWNINSGEGCEPCNCDVVGSINHTCNASGQCFCHENIIGKQCNMCLPYHTLFSSDGCSPCNCDPIGSSSLQCNSTGFCECRPNVEGMRCERCMENTHDKSRGCVDCDPCYNMVQDAANLHRKKMAELAILLDAIKENPKLVDDEEFLQKLEEVSARIDALLEDANSASGFDGSVSDKLKDLRKKLLDIQKFVGIIHAKLDEADKFGDLGKNNITLAEETIKRIQDTLSNAKKYLETEGMEALTKAIERSEKFGRNSERLSEIARDSRKLVEGQEKMANEIESIAFEARNTSWEAHDKAVQAVNLQEDTENEISRLERSVENAENTLNQVKQMAKDAKMNADEIYDDVLELYTDANILLPNVDANELKNSAYDIIEEAKSIQGNVMDLQDKHTDLLNQVEKQKVDAEDLIVEGEKQQQLTDEMLADVKASLEKAQNAVNTGDKILTDAQETLETLKGFDDHVQKSKNKALEALEKVPYIEDLIEDAETKTQHANDSLSDAEFDGIEARNIAVEAQKIAEQASTNANAFLDEAEQTKLQIESLKEQADDLDGRISSTSDRMDEYEKQAETDDTLAKEALEKANQAKTSATEASMKVKQAIDTVEDIMKILDGLDDIDIDVLHKLEIKLNEAEQELKDANFEPKIAELRQMRELQKQMKRDYTEEIEQLKKDVKNIEAINNSLPDECYHTARLEV